MDLSTLHSFDAMYDDYVHRAIVTVIEIVFAAMYLTEMWTAFVA